MDTSKLWMLLLIPVAIAIGCWVVLQLNANLGNRLAVRNGARKARQAERERKARNKYKDKDIAVIVLGIVGDVVDELCRKIKLGITILFCVIGLVTALLGFSSGSHSLRLVGILGGLAIIATGCWFYKSND
jgi:hypothetical protein